MKRSDVEGKYSASGARIVGECEDKPVRRDREDKAKETFETGRRVAFEEPIVEPMSTAMTNVESEETICNKEGSNVCESTDGKGESNNSVNVADSTSVTELFRKWSKRSQRYGYCRVLRPGKSGDRMYSIKINYFCPDYRQQKGFSLDGVYRRCAANVLVKRPLYRNGWIVVRRDLHSYACKRIGEETTREKPS